MSALASHQQSKQSVAGSKQIEAIVVDETTVNNITAVDSSINSIYLMPSDAIGNAPGHSFSDSRPTGAYGYADIKRNIGPVINISNGQTGQSSSQMPDQSYDQRSIDLTNVDTLLKMHEETLTNHL